MQPCAMLLQQLIALRRELWRLLISGANQDGHGQW